MSRVLALEPWYGGSHKRFLDGLRSHSRHTFQSVTMEGRFWRWRMEGGAVTLARKALALYEDGFRPDVIFASDMVHVPAFLALSRPAFSEVPLVLFFHENQLTYPLPEDRKRQRIYPQINYLSALASDRVVFNSHFHHDEFLEALPRHLRAFPDYTHLHTVREICEKSDVLHLGMKLHAHDAHADAKTEKDWGRSQEPPIILWNQRWEYDKDPETFFRVMNRLDDAGYSFRLILAGEHFQQQPPAFERAFERYAGRVMHYGYAEDFAEYSRLLHRADIVVSTAQHEFFGIAVMEATYCGCHPLLPNRLSYPELIPEALHRPLLHAPVLYEDTDELYEILGKLLSGKERPLPRETLQGMARHLDWSEQVEAYDALLSEVAEGTD